MTDINAWAVLATVVVMMLLTAAAQAALDKEIDFGSGAIQTLIVFGLYWVFLQVFA
jgi:hypothetical protein